MGQPKKTKTILLLASTGFIIRNLVLGKFADEIVKHCRLVVAVPDPEDEKLKGILEEKGIEAIHFPFEEIQRNGILREYRLMHNYFYRLKQGHKTSKSLELQTKLWENPGSWKKQLFDKSMIYTGALISRVGLFSKVEKQYLSRYSKNKITSQWVEILKDLDPSYVISTMLSHSGRYRSSSDMAPVLAAHHLAIPCGTLIQSWDNISSKVAILPDWLDTYWTWSKTMSKDLHHFYPGIKKDRVKVIGSPQFDFHLEKDLLETRDVFCKQQGLDPLKKFILIGSGTEKWMPDEPIKLLNLSRRIHNEMPEIQILIRLHPKDHGGRWLRYGKEYQALNVIFQYTSPSKHMDVGGFIPPKDFYKNQVNTIYHSELVLNSSSTITVDAAILDKPIICFGYDLDEDKKFPEGRSFAYTQSNHYQLLVNTGGIEVVKSEQECMDAIKQNMANPGMRAAERKEIVRAVTEVPDGKAGIRLCEDIINML